MHWINSVRQWSLAALLFSFFLLGAARQKDGAAPPQVSAPSIASPQAPDDQGEEARKSPEMVVIIDPSHGGEDKGAVFNSRVVEKDVTLALARELKRELLERGIPVRMLRDSDSSIPLEHRAEIANQQHTALYIALHAGRPGQGVRIYSSLTPARPATGAFLPWDSAQSGSITRSRSIAQLVAKELNKKNMQASVLAATLRPLNNIVPPAIAVELALGPADPSSLQNQKLQNSVGSAIASAIAQSRSEWIGGHL